MAKKAVALHLVEKGLHEKNLHEVKDFPGEWSSGYWVVGEKTASQLVGCKIYLHKGQKFNSHMGGEIISWSPASGENSKRKIFRFRVLTDCAGVPSPEQGWGNEKCIIWKEE